MKTTKYCPATFLTVAKANLLFTAVFALYPALVEAGGPELPPNWDVSGEWQLSQKAEKLVTMKLNQTEMQITGTAISGTTQGKVDGFVSGDTFFAKVTWVATIITKKETVSNYSGKISPRGIITGTMNPADSNWRSESFVSLTAVKRLHPGNDNSSKKQGAPTITANPSTVSMPAGQSRGTTTLTWDGGSEHPYAEIWVKVDDQDETKIVEQGKGSRQVTVERGKTYRYLLEDAGKTLSSITVTVTTK